MALRIQTFTIVVGTTACNASCPYCVSRMTPGCGLSVAPQEINFRNFDIGCRFAKTSGVSTVLLTGKGEPTLYPEQISAYVEKCAIHEFPFVELQTNGILFVGSKADIYRDFLERWYAGGMTTISASIAHYDKTRNAELFTRSHTQNAYDPWQIVEVLHEVGFSVRINCTLVKGYVDSPEEVERLLEVCSKFRVEQATVRNVTRPEDSQSQAVAAWVDEHRIPELEKRLMEYFEGRGAKRLLALPHGAVVYDWHGQNFCINNCLTTDSSPELIRQLIYFPDGHLRYDWKYAGALLL